MMIRLGLGALAVSIMAMPIGESFTPDVTVRLVGMNLAPTSNFSPEYPFIDRFKSFGNWAPNWKPMDPAFLNEKGWPTRMPPDAQSINTAVGLDPDPARYVVTWSGKGEMAFTNLRVVSLGSHRMVFDSIYSSANINIAKTDPTDPIHDVHVYRLDQEALFRRGEIFNPAFIKKIKTFSPLRTMDWSCVNASVVKSWSQRPKLDNAGWNCVPIEVQVALANETGSGLWLNIPALADDDYILQAMIYVRDHLDPALTLHLEYSNEVWNNSFLQNKQAQAAADQIWGKGAPVANGPALYYGYRSAQIAATAKRLFGLSAAKRLSPLLGTFTWGVGYETGIFEGVERAGLGSVSSLFKEYAITAYFGDALGTLGDPADRPIVLGWARGGAAGTNAAFRQFEHGGGGLKSDFSLDSLQPVFARQAKVAAANGLKLVAYEGGLSGVYYVYGDEGAEVANFILKLKTDRRMGVMYERLIKDFRAAGGSNVAIYYDAGINNVFGPWGTLPSLYGTSPAYEALVKLNGR